MALLIWLLLLGYVIYDWSTTRTWWLPWAFIVVTVLYAVWFFRRLCQSMAHGYLQQLSNQLRDQGVVPASGDEVSRVFAECMLSPTGRLLMLRFASPSDESGHVQYSPEAMSVLTAFAQERRTMGDGAELDANTLRWLKVRESLWARLRVRFAVLRGAERQSSTAHREL